VTLNDQQIIGLMLQDDYITNVMGILEYSPKTPGMRAKHREFIKTHGKVKQVVEITDEQISRKIDQTFRLEYLQGIFLHGEGSDEGLMGVINNMIYQNHLEIVNHIQNNHFLLAELFNIFKDPATTAEKKDDIIRFVQQLCNLTKPMQNSSRVNTFRSLAPYGFFDLLCGVLPHPIKSFRVTGLNILASFTDLDVASVRSHIMIQSKDPKSNIKPLIEVIVEEATKDTDHDLKVQYFEILRLLLDPNGSILSGPSGNDVSRFGIQIKIEYSAKNVFIFSQRQNKHQKQTNFYRYFTTSTLPHFYSLSKL
jgi:protein phosphatase-4 regulatory subunit 3